MNINLTQKSNHKFYNMKKIVLLFTFLSFTSVVIAQQHPTTQSQWETYFVNRIQSLDPIEGIWSGSYTVSVYNGNRLVSQSSYPQAFTFAIYKSGNVYKANCLDCKISTRSFQNTAVAGIYLFEIYFAESRSTAKANAILTGGGLLEYSYEVPTAEVKKVYGSSYSRGLKVIYEKSWIKLSPKVEDYNKQQKGSGTGWALSSNGYIVTNHHVVEGAKDIQVRGINGDFNATHKAQVVAQDIVNDLAIIKVPVLLGTIPYTITTAQASVGSNIFVLGYPLRSSMGDEVKLTNGIISSRSGFQGDITNYQISAPVQPGNSGGPMFDDKGNVIGIVTAKHSGAENASYAVKASYLMKLIESMDSPPTLPTTNTISSQSLADQVKALRRFVYIIEVK